MASYRLMCAMAALNMLIPESASQASVCGRPLLNTRIVGGQTALWGSWPWQVSLLNPSHFCGGSLINNQWVLSAAHCVRGITASRLRVALGRQSQSGSNPNEVLRDVSEIIVHPDYNSETVDNDFALLRLSSPVTFTAFIVPVCLAAPDSSVHAGVSTWVTGWGTLEEGGSGSDDLMEVQVPIVGNRQCNCKYGVGRITDNMLCAGFSEGGRDACQGDSGGPLVSKQGDVWIQLGVVSFGLGCARPEFPGVYARVSRYMSWINSIITSNQPGYITYTSTGTDSDLSVSCAGLTTSTTTTTRHPTTTIKTTRPTTTTTTTTTRPTTTITTTTTTTRPTTTTTPKTTRPTTTTTTTTTPKTTRPSSTTTTTTTTTRPTTTTTTTTTSKTTRPTTTTTTTTRPTTTRPTTTTTTTTTRPTTTTTSPSKTTTTTTPSATTPTPVVCGRAPLNSRIEGGSSVASAGTWPWMASLQRNGTHVCGGTLVSEDTVMSDAGCFSSSLVASEWTVVLGRLQQSGSNPFEVMLSVTNIALSTLNGSNVALLRLSTRPTLTNYIQPICLDDGRTFAVGTTCWAAGWSSGQGSSSSDQQVLQEIQTSVANCGNTSTAVSICTPSFPLEQGNYGGPLMCLQDSSWFQAAVLTSEDTPTSRTQDDSAMVFTRVTWFKTFLRENMGPSLSPASTNSSNTNTNTNGSTSLDIAANESQTNTSGGASNPSSSFIVVLHLLVFATSLQFFS